MIFNPQINSLHPLKNQGNSITRFRMILSKEVSKNIHSQTKLMI